MSRSALALGALVSALSAAAPALAAGPGGSSVEVSLLPPASETSSPRAPSETPLEPDPGAVAPQPDPGEPVGPPELPPHGLADRPYLPTVDRDMVTPRQGGAGRGTAQLSFAKVGEDLFADINFVYIFKRGAWRVAPRLPLRIRLVDAAPETEELIRVEDWDEASDWARLLAFVQYGQRGDPFYLRYGELNGVTVGHGALVNRYFNSVDIDHYQGGVFTTIDLGLAGGEVLVDNILDPELLVTRLYLRPFDLFDGWAFAARKLKLGLTLGADFAAPLAVGQSSATGLYAHPDWSPLVLADEVAGLFGVDLEVPALSTPHVDIVPYADLATVDGKGLGLHLGSYLNLRFNKDASLRMRFEYRLVGQGYTPGYISPFYEIERYATQAGPPKLTQLKSGALGDGYNGAYLEGDLRLAGILRYTLIYSAGSRERGDDLLMRLRLPHLGSLRLTLFFARLGFDGLDNLFAADRTVGGVSARVLFGDAFFFRARLVNEWWLARGEGAESHFETTLNFNLGAGVLIHL